MAQTSNFVPQYDQGYSFGQQQSSSNSAFVIINQQPSRREVFPYRLQTGWIFAFSVGKCILGSLLFVVGIVNVAMVKYDTKIAFAIWCGLTILANGIIGCILKYKQTKCLMTPDISWKKADTEFYVNVDGKIIPENQKAKVLGVTIIGAFLGLSITSLIFTISMLAFYSVVLEYFVNFRRFYCYNYYSYYGGYRYRCDIYMSSDTRALGIGITAFLMALVVSELACSIGSVAVACKAFSKCCNTCDANDCCTCLGCGECDCTPLNIQQGTQPAASTYFGQQNMQMSSFQPPPYQLNQQRAQSNPCSDMVSFIINIPSYVFGTANGTQLSAINVNLQPVTSNQQVPLNEQGRTVGQVQGVDVVGNAQPNSALMT